MGLLKHGPQYHEYKGIKDSILENIQINKKSVFLTEFETNKNEIKNFINYFFENGIKNQSLRKKLYENFNDGDFILDDKPGGVNQHVFNMVENELVVDVFKRANLGDKLPTGTYVSNIKTIRGIIHELAHSSSQKFDKDFLNTNESKQKLANHSLEKDTAIGEIEAKFIEKVFNDFILNNASEIEKSGCSINGIQDLHEEIQDLEKYDTCDFLERLTIGINEDDPNYRQSVDHRYIIGTIVSSLLYEDYKKDPEGTLEHFNNYLENQCSMNINDTVSFLTKGKSQHFGEAVEQYKQMIQEKNNNQTQTRE